MAGAVAALPAQQPALQPETTRPRPSDYVLVDRVEAKVGDDAILRSRVMSAAAGDIRVKEGLLGRQLTPPEQQFMFKSAKDKLVDQYAMAQAVKTLGILPPERIEDILRERLEQAEAEEVRQWGTMARFTQVLSRQNRTWESWRRDTRMLEELRLTRELAVGGRLQNQTNLFITPRMLRDYYEQHRSDYVYEARCQIDMLRVDASGNLERARQVATAAAETWRGQEINSRQLAEKSQKQQAGESAAAVEVASAGRVYEVTSELKQTLRPALAEFIATFTRSHPLMAVSEPIQDGNNLWLVKVVDRVDGRSSTFDAPEVQADIRQKLEIRLIHHLTEVAIKRARERTYVWDIERGR